MGHEGLEPSANGLRVHCDPPKHGVFHVIPGSAEVSERAPKALSGHGVPNAEALRAAAEAVTRAVEDRDHASLERVALDLAELVAEVIEGAEAGRTAREG